MKIETLQSGVYLGDCYELIKKIPDKSIDLIITDPPYEFGTDGVGTGIFKYRESLNDTYQEIRQNNLGKGIDDSILDEWCRVMKYIYIYIWCNKEQIPTYLKYFIDKNCNYEFIVWGKDNPPPFTSGHYLKDKEYCLLFWEKGVKIKGNYETLKTIYLTHINISDKNEYCHPTIKPLNIIKNFVLNSTNEGDIVLDTFAGSGTTLKACKDLNRRYIGFEINEKYYQIAKDRLENINAKGEVKLF